jgi:transcriptional regulator with XRE-family HTH domain
MVSKTSFGSFLRDSRLKACYGLRAFAVAVGMQPSNLSNIEHDRIPPPQDHTKLEEIARVLGLHKDSKEYQRLFDLAVRHKPDAIPPDVAVFVAKNPGIPTLLRTIEKTKLSKKDLRELSQYIKEHLTRA